MSEDLTRAFTNPATKRSAWSLVLASENQLDVLAEQMPLAELIRLALRELGDEGLEPFVLPFLISASGRGTLAEEMARQGVLQRLFEHMDSHVPLKLSLLCNLSREELPQQQLLANEGLLAAKLASWVSRDQFELGTQVLANLSTLEAGRDFLSSNSQKFLQFLSLFLDTVGVRGQQACRVFVNMLQSGQDLSKETAQMVAKRLSEVLSMRYPCPPASLSIEAILKCDLPAFEGEPDLGLREVLDILGSMCRDADCLEVVQAMQPQLCALFQDLYLAGKSDCLPHLKVGIMMPAETLELRTASGYTGLPRACSEKFQQFAPHPLYQFPLASNRSRPSAARKPAVTLLPPTDFTCITQKTMTETLEQLHEASPFRRGVAPEIAAGSFSFSQDGREAPMNTVNSESSHGSRGVQRDFDDLGSFEASPIRTPVRTLESVESLPRCDSQEDFGKSRRARRSIRSAIRDYSEDIPSDEEADASLASGDTLGDRLARMSTNKDFKRIVELIPEECEDDSALMFKSVDALKQAGIIEEEEESEADVSAEQIHLVPRETSVKANKPTCDLQQVQPKVLNNSTLRLSTVNDTMLAIEPPDVHSPLAKKLVICEEVRRSVVVETREGAEAHRMQVLCAFACAGYKATVGLEFSNVEGRSRAAVNYAHEADRLPAKLLTPSILRFFMSTPVHWVSCGFEHCAIVTVEGDVLTWGYGGSGALGHGNTLSYAAPTRVQGLSGIVYLECGGYHNAALNSAGRLWMWGRGDVNQLGISFKKLIYDELGYLAKAPIEIEEFSRWRKTVQGVACGEAHTLVLDSEGGVYAFGWAEDGQLGLPPAAISEGMMTTKIEKLDLQRIVKVAAGSLFSAALSENGAVYVWGNGEQGQLGLGNKALKRDRPTQLTALADESILDLMCGDNFGLALTLEGDVYGWGQGVAGDFEGGQFNQGSELVCYVPRRLTEVAAAHHIALPRAKKSSAEQPSFLWALEEELRRLEMED